MNLNQTVGLSAIAIGIVTSLSVARVDSQAPPTPDQMVAALKHAPSRLEQRLEDGRGRERPASTGPRRPIHHRVPHKKHHGAMIAW